MKKWSHFLAALALSLSFFSSTNAGCCYDPCPCPPPPSNCGGCGVQFGAEFLYRKVCLDEFSYAYTVSSEVIVADTFVDYEYEKLCLDYEPGVRAWLGFGQDGCMGVTFGYTFLSGNAHDQTAGVLGSLGVESTIFHPSLADQHGGFNLVEVQWDHYYHEGEIVFGSDISCGKCHEFKPFFGVAGIYLEQKFELDLTDPEVEFDGDEGNVDWKAENWGVGLRFGSHYNYNFDNCFGFYGKFDASLLVGQSTVTNYQELILASESDARTVLNFYEKDKCHFVPGFSVGAGFSMTPDICGSGSSFSLVVGYEYNVWYNIPNHRTFTSSNGEANLNPYSDSGSTRTWGDHGLFAGLEIGF